MRVNIGGFYYSHKFLFLFVNDFNCLESGLNKPSLTDAYLNRFAGIGRLYGNTALHVFAQSHVAVVGIGGVGEKAKECLRT